MAVDRHETVEEGKEIKPTKIIEKEISSRETKNNKQQKEEEYNLTYKQTRQVFYLILVPNIPVSITVS